MFSRFGILADWIITHRWLTTVLLVGWTLFTAIGHYDPTILFPEPSYGDQRTPTSGEDADFQARQLEPLPDVEPLRVDLGNVIVVARSDDFFTGQGVQAMRTVVDALESHIDGGDAGGGLERAVSQDHAVGGGAGVDRGGEPGAARRTLAQRCGGRSNDRGDGELSDHG